MRLWSLHPRYLDPPGLVALWREGLLAQKVLRGETRGYRFHPQLRRFSQSPDPSGLIAAYLAAVADEAEARGYAFDRSRITAVAAGGPLPVQRGQIEYEWAHLLRKLEGRAPALGEAHREIGRPEPHPLFRVVPGGVEGWERPA